MDEPSTTGRGRPAIGEPFQIRLHPGPRSVLEAEADQLGVKLPEMVRRVVETYLDPRADEVAPARRIGRLMAVAEEVDKELYYRYWTPVVGGSTHALRQMIRVIHRRAARMSAVDHPPIAWAALLAATASVEEILPALPGHLSLDDQLHIGFGYYMQLAVFTRSRQPGLASASATVAP